MIRQLVFLTYMLALVMVWHVIDVARVDAVDLQTVVRITVCGDGIVSGLPEVCDEGPSGNLGAYASTTALRTCAPGCESYGPYCGDAILQVRFNEECDDGNHTNGDLCTAACKTEVAVPPGNPGSPTVGSTPNIPGGTPGVIPSQTETRVVLRGKSYPNSQVNILMDGKTVGTVQADANADFLFSTSNITPGTATFGFWAKDRAGNESITTSVIFEVVQSAVTTVANVFFPPTLVISEKQVQPGALVTISGQTVPDASVVTEINGGPRTELKSLADSQGEWALQVDTRSISVGQHTAKAYFESSPTERSGFGKSISFTVGGTAIGGVGSPDLNGDGKTNLVDFSIFLISWGSSDAKGDFNGDGNVNLADFSIMLFNWTG